MEGLMHHQLYELFLGYFIWLAVFSMCVSGDNYWVPWEVYINSETQLGAMACFYSYCFCQVKYVSTLWTYRPVELVVVFLCISFGEPRLSPWTSGKSTSHLKQRIRHRSTKLLIQDTFYFAVFAGGFFYVDGWCPSSDYVVSCNDNL
jgi:hypothetical protein